MFQRLLSLLGEKGLYAARAVRMVTVSFMSVAGLALEILSAQIKLNSGQFLYCVVGFDAGTHR